MKSSVLPYIQLISRCFYGLGFIIPVLDRIGLLGAPGTGIVAWGTWENFQNYTHTLLPFLSKPISDSFGFGATLLEAVFGICLMIGFKTKWVSLGSALITFMFALSMIANYGIGAPFKYPVFVFTSLGLLLFCVNDYKWSIDALLKNRKQSAL